MRFLFCLYWKREIRCARLHLTFRKPFLDCRPPFPPSIAVFPVESDGQSWASDFISVCTLPYCTSHIIPCAQSVVLYCTERFTCACARAWAYCFALLLYCFLPLLLHFIRAEHTISTHKRGFLIPLILPGYLLPVRKYESTYLLFPLLFPKV
jgi:hypothetical protein